MVQITCKCGAVYEVTTHRAPYGHSETVRCEVCGVVMDKFDGVTVYETYCLIGKGRNDIERT